MKPSANNENVELAAILDTMADGLFVVDSARRVRCWNPAMERITGYAAAETLGQPCGVFTWIEKDTDTEEEGMYCRLFAAGSMDRSELTVLCKDGSTLPVLASARTLKDTAGNPTGAVVTITDISTLKRLETEVSQLRQELGGQYQFQDIVGKSPSMRQVFRLIELAADSETTVLVRGETGTGKELVAKAIHFNSPRKNGPLVSVNCSALSETLVESELFGHVRGSFTGALRDHVGRFERANGGTLFLDEVGEIPPMVQVKLLRVIQEREIERIGESKVRKVDVRIIAATHRDLRERVEQGLFREDLFYRLNVFPIHLPPLRERREDIPPLVDHLTEKYNGRTNRKISGVTPEAMRLIMDYCWPGNVRELENAVEHAFVTSTGGRIDALDLPLEVRRTDVKDRICDRKKSSPSDTPAPRSLRRASTREDLVAALKDCNWNKAEAARRLGITRTHVWRLMVRYKIPLTPES